MNSGTAGSHAGQPGKSCGRRKPIVFLIERPASLAEERVHILTYRRQVLIEFDKEMVASR